MYNYNYAYNAYNVPYYFDNIYQNLPYYDSRPNYIMPVNVIKSQIAQYPGSCFSATWGEEKHYFHVTNVDDKEGVIYYIENGAPGVVAVTDITGFNPEGPKCPPPGPPTGTWQPGPQTGPPNWQPGPQTGPPNWQPGPPTGTWQPGPQTGPPNWQPGPQTGPPNWQPGPQTGPPNWQPGPQTGPPNWQPGPQTGPPNWQPGGSGGGWNHGGGVIVIPGIGGFGWPRVGGIQR